MGRNSDRFSRRRERQMATHAEMDRMEDEFGPSANLAEYMDRHNVAVRASRAMEIPEETIARYRGKAPGTPPDPPSPPTA